MNSCKYFRKTYLYHNSYSKGSFEQNLYYKCKWYLIAFLKFVCANHFTSLKVDSYILRTCNLQIAET